MPHNKFNLSAAVLSSLWVNWAVAFGALALMLLCSVFVSKKWLPLVVLVSAYGLYVFMQQRRGMGQPGTAAVKVCCNTLMWSAVIMIVINIMHGRSMVDGFFTWSDSNAHIPYITSLVIFPVLTIMALWSILTGYGQIARSGWRVRRAMLPSGPLSDFFIKATRYQVNVLCMFALTLSVLQWWYYFTYYINVNLNTPDRFFFNWLPILFYLASLYFMWTRYTNIASVLGPIEVAHRSKGVALRYLVLADNRLLLQLNDHGRWDTPMRTYIPQLDADNRQRISDVFERLSGFKEFTLKYLFGHPEGGIEGPSLHYAAFVPESEASTEGDDRKGKWFTLDQIDRMLSTAQLSADLSEEVYRIFTITMAWKTYDRSGRRLYPIRNYRPTFRLNDLSKWTVDYDDDTWLAVARNNQDRPFFRTRRLWNKITGLRQ